ncbi:hypothetical protein T5B8_00990 [Salinisphaera sp. T5B8]|uniref:DUF3080 family protein n=1 Tax=unclassified Salinisphaera TaxID=2649847 RepID=UPI0033412AAA
MAILLVAALAGCRAADSPQARFDDYLTRLARTLERDLPAATATPRSLYPPRRALAQPVQTPRTGWIGFFQLHRCGLVNLISERNSILGRVAPPQARLAYESRLLAGLIRCRAGFDGDTEHDAREFVARLDRLIALKRQARGAIIWNQTMASAPMAHLFSIAGDNAGLEPSLAGRSARAALTRLTAAMADMQAERVVSEDTLVGVYETLDASEYGGALQIAALQAAAALERASQLIETRLNERPLCFNHRPNRRARVLHTILVEIYGPRVQAYLADLVRAGRLWRETVNALIDRQRVTLPPEFTRYRARTLSTQTGIWARLDQAIENHTEHWQQAMRQCDLMPAR